MTPHIEAQSGDFAPCVLLPGDSLRAEWVAMTLLDRVRRVNTLRGSGVFYSRMPDGCFDAARKAGKLAVNTETSALFSDAHWLGVRTLSFCTVVDNPVTGQQIDPSERFGVFSAMATLALEVAYSQG